MPSPIKRVAVIGAGISGVCSAAHLLKQGLEVVLFERSSVAGGIWHFDEKTAPEPEYPNTKPSLGDYKIIPPKSLWTPPRTPSPGKDLAIEHAPPGPCYAGLRTNTILRSIKTTLGDWPEGLPDFVERNYLEDYIQKIAESLGDVVEYNTRVEEVHKEQDWVVRTTTLLGNELEEKAWHFDAIVIASGHYNMPRIPNIPGLKEWKSRYPDRVQHSKGYRSPAAFKQKRVLLIGCGASSLDVAREASPIVKQMYQSSRGGAMDAPPEMFPSNTLRVGGIKAFHPDAGFIELNNGSRLRDIDHVILGTGYVVSYPFLPQFHADGVLPEHANESVLVTANGDMTHNLYKDIFYCPDPTLAFVGVSYHVSTFSLYEFQAQVVARIFAGKAMLPPRNLMRNEYEERLARKGVGKDFHNLRDEGDELAYVADLVAWMNADALRTGAVPMQGHTEEFLQAHRELREMIRSLGISLDRSAKGKSYDHVRV